MVSFRKKVEDAELDKIRSSVDQLNHFISSPVWLDFKELIELQMDYKHLLLETVPEDELKGIQKSLETLRIVLDMPQVLLEQREAEDKSKPKTKED